MARPTIAEQIAKAAAAGEFDKVQELASKLASQQQKKKTVKSKKERKTPVKKEEEEIVQPTIEYGEDDFIAPARGASKSSKYIDDDGRERVKMRTVPYVIKNGANAWTDDEASLSDAEIDKKLHNHNKKVEQREPVTRFKIVCTRCDREKFVWPGEVMVRNYICDRCLLSNKR